MSAEERDTEGIDRLFEAKAAAEVALADRLAPGSDVIASRGCLVATVAALKGSPGPAEASGGAAVSGADGEALVKALAALGYDPEQAFFALTRPDAGVAPDARAARVRMLVEAVDAPLVIALDATAAEDVAAAFGLEGLPFGERVVASGRHLVAVDGFEASLIDERDKKRVWGQLQAAKPLPPAY